ncbi:hypothetical protein [Priestia megaterium]|uniref:Uncharacterized protein n=1 Tax=Priestia megaterium TaxID=1404 RepID=A0A6M6E156_PRIMG|nr:hypothetical protein [Priestia megaterium]QJX80550.1 hypothetical protein FDZ14_31160 [Priestia megaterium]
MIPSRHIDDINRLSDKQISEIKESIRKGENEDELLWFLDLDRGVYEEIKKTVKAEVNFEE